MSPVRRKFPPWELMARATKNGCFKGRRGQPQVGASGGARAVCMMYFFLSTAYDVFFSSRFRVRVRVRVN